LEVAIDKQGRIVIPKEIREKYGLSEDGKLELVAREDVIELVPLIGEDDLAIRSLKEPCKTGNPESKKEGFLKGEGLETMRIIDADILSYAFFEKHDAHPYCWSLLQNAVHGKTRIAIATI
jgi:AbrB family looped-hinge helix DNA binding protein